MSYLNYISKKVTKDFGIRHTYNEKTNFLEFIDGELKSLGYETEIIQGKNIKQCRNLCTVEGNEEIIFMAHYDTPGTMPKFLGFIFKLFGHTRQITGSIIYIIIILLLIRYLRNISNVSISYMIIFILIIFPMLIKNKNNYNDNSSGVVTLLNIAYELKNNENLKGKVDKIKMVFLDNEESGLLGSNLLSKYWQEKDKYFKEKKIINFDCVGIGDIPMVYYSKELDYKLADSLQNILCSCRKNSKKFMCKYYPLSDDFSFKKNPSVSIIFSNNSIIPGGYYMPNVHCLKDNVLELKNIRWLTKAILEKI
ncbi:M28 family peptidase [Clostridium sporogenes]|uniref:M28 family peptidase n=1 Tax=Clostridium sporogenes TaxID=1509 RepID=UPI0013D17B65|nr:M28 family peptidase [Clostridium sporogenes]NFV12158.1 M28 family peptidase [Clostridium sporogenes]